MVGCCSKLYCRRHDNSLLSRQHGFVVVATICIVLWCCCCLKSCCLHHVDSFLQRQKDFVVVTTMYCFVVVGSGVFVVVPDFVVLILHHLAAAFVLVPVLVLVLLCVVILAVCCRLLISVVVVVVVVVDAAAAVVVLVVVAVAVVVCFSCCCSFLVVDKNPEVATMHVIQLHFGGLLVVRFGFSLVQTYMSATKTCSLDFQCLILGDPLCDNKSLFFMVGLVWRFASRESRFSDFLLVKPCLIIKSLKQIINRKIFLAV